MWIGDRLSFLEQLSLKSFLSQGYHVKLYHYSPVEGVPDGVELADANEILSARNHLREKWSGSVALYSDIFRFHMMKKCKHTIWVDLDVYCFKQFNMEKGKGEFLFGLENFWNLIGSSVMLLPQDSETLARLLDFTSDEYAIPTWYGERYTRKLKKARDQGKPVHVSSQPWGVWGPDALTHFLRETGEITYALPLECMYPLTLKPEFHPHLNEHGDFKFNRVSFRPLLSPDYDTSHLITKNTYCIHLFASLLRNRLTGNAKIPEKSLLGEMLHTQGIDPSKMPIPSSVKSPRDYSFLKVFRTWALLLFVLSLILVTMTTILF